jgi:hypothetical protein
VRRGDGSCAYAARAHAAVRHVAELELARELPKGYYLVESVQAHRGRGRTLELKVRCMGYGPEDHSWEPAWAADMHRLETVREYCKARGLPLPKVRDAEDDEDGEEEYCGSGLEDAAAAWEGGGAEATVCGRKAVVPGGTRETVEEGGGVTRGVVEVARGRVVRMGVGVGQGWDAGCQSPGRALEAIARGVWNGRTIGGRC